MEKGGSCNPSLFKQLSNRSTIVLIGSVPASKKNLFHCGGPMHDLIESTSNTYFPFEKKYVPTAAFVTEAKCLIPTTFKNYPECI